MKNAIGHSPYAVSGKLWRFSSITIIKRERKTMTAGNWTHSGTMDHKPSKREKKHRILARKAAEKGIVLLKKRTTFIDWKNSSSSQIVNLAGDAVDDWTKAAKEQRKARKAQFKANEEKLEKLVKEYKSAKDGSKKQASLRKDIGEVLEQVREEQIAIRAEGLQDFEQRLARMKEGLAKEQEPAAKTAWVEKMTDEIIAEDGDFGEALMSHGRMGPMPRGPMGPQMDGPMLPPPPLGPDGEPAK